MVRLRALFVGGGVRGCKRCAAEIDPPSSVAPSGFDSAAMFVLLLNF